MKKLFIILFLLSTIHTKAQVAEKDSLALVALYNGTNGENWYMHSFWLNEYSLVGEWQGVVVQNNRVVQLHLGYNNLNGAIPEEFGNLDSLSILDLKGAVNLILPHSIGNLSTLDTLLLNYAVIDTLPDETGNLHDLTYLSLNNTLIRYLPDDISGLSKLEFLLCDNGKLRKIPQSIGALSNLKLLGLGVNEITELPASIGNCTKLTGLLINANDIPEIPSTIGNLTNLEALILGGNKLNTLPDEIFTLTKLKMLNFAANGLKIIPSSIGNLTNLEDFQFFENEFTSIPDEIGNLVNLTYINGYSNKINALPLSLLNLPNVNTLYLAWNSLTFEDIEPLVSINGFEYYLQDSIGKTNDTVVPSNSTFYMECITGGAHNKYQWFKNGDSIAGATSYFLDFPVLAFADSGVYNCLVTNAIATGLKLYSKPVLLHIRGTAGTSEFNFNTINQFSISPNPATSSITITTTRLSTETLITLFNASGQQVLQQKFRNQNIFEMDINALKPGIYLVQVQTKEGIETRKLVIQ